MNNDWANKRHRVWLYLITWVVALFAAGKAVGARSWVQLLDPRGLVLLPLFPAGLITLFGINPQGDIFGPVACGWLVYIALIIGGMRVRGKFPFFLLYGTLLALLICNIMGCRMMKFDVH